MYHYVLQYVAFVLYVQKGLDRSTKKLVWMGGWLRAIPPLIYDGEASVHVAEILQHPETYIDKVNPPQVVAPGIESTMPNHDQI